MAGKNHECFMPDREVARVQDPDVILARGYFPGFGGNMKFKGSGQGFGYGIDVEFLKGFMDVFGVESLKECNGRPCWVTHCNSAIHKIEPLIPDEGKTFDIDEWAEQAQARGKALRELGLDTYSIEEAKRKEKQACK